MDKKRRRGLSRAERRRRAERKKKIILVLLILLVLLLLLAIGLLVRSMFFDAPAGSSSENQVTGNAVTQSTYNETQAAQTTQATQTTAAEEKGKASAADQQSYPLFAEQDYYGSSTIEAAYGNCFVADVDGSSLGREYVLVSYDGRILAGLTGEWDIYTGERYHGYHELDDGNLMLSSWSDYNDGFVIFDPNGQKIGEFTGSEEVNAYMPENGNYYVVTANSDEGHNSTFYRLDGSVICSVEGKARRTFNKQGFAVLTRVNDHSYSGYNTIIDTNGQSIEFTMAGGEHDGKTVEAFEFDQMNDRVAEVDTIWLSDGSKITNEDYVIVDAENRKLHIPKRGITAVSDEYLISRELLLNRYGDQVLLDVREKMNDESARIGAVLSDDGPYLAVYSDQGFAIMDGQGNLVAPPMSDVSLNVQNEWGTTKYDANDAGMFIISTGYMIENKWVTKHGVMNLKGEILVPPIYDRVSCTESGYAVLDQKQIIDAQGQTVFTLAQ